MTVISDTTCLSALARIGKLELLQAVFGSVIIPQKVLEELEALRNFGIDASLFTQLNWLEVREPIQSPLLERLLSTKRIDPGESHAIALAFDLRADWVILDDLNARKEAVTLGLNVTGLGGILLQAKAAGIIKSVREILDLCIEKANFRLSPDVFERIMTLSGEE